MTVDQFVSSIEARMLGVDEDLLEDYIESELDRADHDLLLDYPEA